MGLVRSTRHLLRSAERPRGSKCWPKFGLYCPREATVAASAAALGVGSWIGHVLQRYSGFERRVFCSGLAARPNCASHESGGTFRNPGGSSCCMLVPCDVVWITKRDSRDDRACCGRWIEFA